MSDQMRFNRLAEALQDLVGRARREQEGKRDKPWPEIDRAEAVLSDPEVMRRPTGIRDYLIYDTVETTVARLEAFSDEFGRLATSADQLRLADEFRLFVAETVALLGMAEHLPAKGGRPGLDELRKAGEQELSRTGGGRTTDRGRDGGR